MTLWTPTLSDKLQHIFADPSYNAGSSIADEEMMSKLK